jgi:hypothetical protein
LELPEVLATIGAGSFRGCSSLTSLVMPDTLIDIGDEAFAECSAVVSVSLGRRLGRVGGGAFRSSGIGSVAIPNSVTSLGLGAFESCSRLTNVTMGSGLTRLESRVFRDSRSLRRVTVGENVTRIGQSAFQQSGVTTVILPAAVGFLDDRAFGSCNALTGVYFTGKAPTIVGVPFNGSSLATVFYREGTTGWSSSFAGRPARVWDPRISVSDPAFGLREGRFGFRITGATGLRFLVEVPEAIADPQWVPLTTHVLTGGEAMFQDAEWNLRSSRFYRISPP